MMAIFDIQDSFSNKVSYWLLGAFLVLLPYDFFYSELALACFALHTLIHLRKERIKNLFTRKVALPVSLFLLIAVAIFYSPDKPEALNVTTRQLAIFLMPVLLSLTNLDLRTHGKGLLLLFAFSCSLCVAYLFADALHTLAFYRLPWSYLFTPAFMNHNFSSVIGLHATYLSVYVAFSIIILLYYLLSGTTRWNNYGYSICLLLLTAGMLQLSSRAAFIGLLLVVNVLFPLLLPNKRKRSAFFIATGIASVCFLVLIFSSGSFKERYVNELKSDLSLNPQLAEAMEPRAQRWKAAWELVEQAPLTGHGTGAEKQLLLDKYFEKKMYNAYVNEFNAHNQYLAMLINTGFPGLLLLVFILTYGMWQAWRNKDLLFLSFLLMTAIVCISENFLELNKGIFFYSFFFSFFLERNTRQQIC